MLDIFILVLRLVGLHRVCVCVCVCVCEISQGIALGRRATGNSWLLKEGDIFFFTRDKTAGRLANPKRSAIYAYLKIIIKGKHAVYLEHGKN